MVCRAYGPVESLSFEEVQPPALGAGEVRVRIHAAGLNFADALKIEGKHQVKPALPWTPGIEIAGIVTELGAGVVGLKPGDRVMGAADDRAGGYAESIVLPADRLLPLAAHLGFEQAAGLPSAYGTALYALQQCAGLRAGQWILVLGAAGGVGLAAVQIAKCMGAQVIAAASSRAKRELALAHGAMHAIDYTQPDWRKSVLALTGSGGVDVVFDPVGGDVFDEAVRTIGWGGRYLVVGFASGRIPALAMNLPLVKGYNIVGVRYDVWRDRFWAEARANLTQVLYWWSGGQLEPVISRIEPLPNAAQALALLTSRASIGKIVLSAS